MPSSMLHLISAKEYIAEPDVLFFLGSLAPDCIDDWVRKDILHLRKSANRETDLTELAKTATNGDSFFKNKTKPCVVFLFSIIALGTLIISTLLAVLICSKWYGLVVGVIFMGAAIPLHIGAQRLPFFHVLSSAANFVGCGFSVSAYYLSNDISLNFIELLLAALPAALILLLVYIVLRIFPKSKRVTLCVAAILNVIISILALSLTIGIGSILFSFGFFSLFISIFYICVFGITVNHDERPVLKDISYGSFGLFAILTIIVIATLTEGEILEALIPDINIGKKKKLKNIN